MQPTITLSELTRLSLCMSDDRPQAIEMKGKRYGRMGVGWVCEGDLEGDETLVVD